MTGYSTTLISRAFAGETVFDKTIERLFLEAEEEAARLGDLQYFDSRAFFEYRIKFPENYDPSKSYDLIVGLHGFGSNIDRFITLWDKFDSPDFIYVTPRAPYPFLVGNQIGYTWEMYIDSESLQSRQTTSFSERYIAGVVTDLTRKYNIDDVYLLGFSQGCGMTYKIGIKYHEMFTGLICFGGWLDIDWLSEEEILEAKNLKVLIIHGNEDRMVEFESGKSAFDYLSDLGYDVVLEQFDGAHEVPEEMCKLARKWMAGH